MFISRAFQIGMKIQQADFQAFTQYLFRAIAK